MFPKKFGLATSLLLLAVTISFSLWWQWPRIAEGTLEGRHHVRWWNNEVVGHTTNILVSYDQAWRHDLRHSVLPAVPFARDETRRRVVPPKASDELPWSAFRPDRYGNIVYLSFPPAPFLMMFGILKAAGAPIAPSSVRLLGFMLVSLTALLMAAFVWRATDRYDSPAIRAAGATLAGAVFMFSSETWHSGTASVWAHHIAQPLFVGTALIFAFVPPGRWRAFLLGCMAFLSASAEWSGYMLTFGLFLWSALAAWCSYRRGLTARSHLLDAIAVALGTATALGVMLVHYEWAIGLDVWLDRILARSAQRSLGTITDTTPLDLLYYLWLSANGWLIGTAILAILSGFARVRLGLSWPVIGALFGLGMALLENAVMGAHVIVYSFDSYKLICLLGILMGILFVHLVSIRRSYLLACGAVVLLSLGLSQYYFQSIYGLPPRVHDGAAKRVADTIRESAEPDDLIMLMPLAGQFQDLRKSDDFLVLPPSRLDAYNAELGEAAYEVQNMEQAQSLLQAKGWAKGKVYELKAEPVGGAEVYTGVERIIPVTTAPAVAEAPAASGGAAATASSTSAR